MQVKSIHVFYRAYNMMRLTSGLILGSALLMLALSFFVAQYYEMIDGKTDTIVTLGFTGLMLMMVCVAKAQSIIQHVHNTYIAYLKSIPKDILESTNQLDIDSQQVIKMYLEYTDKAA